MEKKNKAAIVYGYTICVVVVITFIISVGGLINAVINLSDPLHAGYYGNNEPSLASFNNYKADILKSQDKGQTVVWDDATLTSMYEAAKTDRIQKVTFDAHRSIIVNGVLIVICVVLFIIHWTWLRRLSKKTVEISV